MKIKRELKIFALAGVELYQEGPHGSSPGKEAPGGTTWRKLHSSFGRGLACTHRDIEFESSLTKT